MACFSISSKSISSSLLILLLCNLELRGPLDPLDDNIDFPPLLAKLLLLIVRIAVGFFAVPAVVTDLPKSSLEALGVVGLEFNGEGVLVIGLDQLEKNHYRYYY